MSKKLFLLILIGSAILVGALYAAPQLLIKRQLNSSGKDFTLSQFTYLDDGGDAYFQFAREVFDGHFPSGNLFSSDKKPDIFPTIPPLILASLIVIFRNINTAYIGANFFFSAALFAMLYFLGTIIFEKNRLWSLFFGFVGALTPLVMHSPDGFFTPANLLNVVLKNFYPGVQTYLPMLFLARIDYPLLTNLIYFPAIACLMLFWLRPRKLYAVLAGVSAGLLFYTYFHFWVYWVVVVGLLFLHTLIFARQDKVRLRNFIILIPTTILVSIPYFINYLQLKGLPSFSDYSARLGVEMGRVILWWAWPHFVAYGLLAVLIYLNLWKKIELRNWAIIFWGFLLAAAVVWNIQLVLGFVPHADHWPRAISPLILLMIFSLLYHWSQKWKWSWTRAVLITLTALLIIKKIVNAAGFVSLPEEKLKDYVFPAEITASFRWLDKNLKEPRVLSSSFVDSMYLSALTSARPFMPWGGVVAISNFDLEELFLRSNKLFQVPESVLEQRLRGGKNLKCAEVCDWLPTEANRLGAPSFIYGLYFDGMNNWPANGVPEEKIQELLQRYRKLQVGLNDFRSDYIYYGPLERAFSHVDFSKQTGLDQVYKNATVEIYKIR